MRFITGDGYTTGKEPLCDLVHRDEIRYTNPKEFLNKIQMSPTIQDLNMCKAKDIYEDQKEVKYCLKILHAPKSACVLALHRTLGLIVHYTLKIFCYIYIISLRFYLKSKL